ncbi:MAG: stage V sporulation protein AA [Tissierellaceae bacterium]|nr:stage V sporulation protein AA [Tissierellaceae bacterium]
MQKEKVYLTINKKATLDPKRPLLVKDLGEVYCNNQIIQKNIEMTEISTQHNKEDWDYKTAIEIAEVLLTQFPMIELDLLGEVEVLIEYKSETDKNTLWKVIKVAAVCIILFFGSSLALINFHEDVNSSKTMKDLYYTFTGERKENPLLLVIPYSIGIGVGVVTFFSRVISSSLRRVKEPGPMEIQLYLYDKDMEENILNETKKP